LPQSICDKIIKHKTKNYSTYVNVKHSYSTDDEMVKKLCIQ